MRLRFWERPAPFEVMTEKREIDFEPASSKVSDLTYQGWQFVLRPEVDFATSFNYYTTIGKVQNAVESFIADILTRDWYYDGQESAVKIAEAWEDEYHFQRLLESTIRDWLVCGNSIVGMTDWLPVQMYHVVGLKRDIWGNVTNYVFNFNGKWEDLPLPVDSYILSRYIDLNRKPWGLGMFHALETQFALYGGSSIPQLEGYRRHIQNVFKTEERYAWPVVIWAYENLSKAEWEKQKEELKGYRAGMRKILNRIPTLLSETIDGSRSGLLEATRGILDAEVEAGLQSAVNRLITQPSALADAREANARDDARTLLIMQKIATWMNTQVLPKVTGGKLEFRWGKQDSFSFDFDKLISAYKARLISPQEAREMMAADGWKLDEGLYRSFTDHAHSENLEEDLEGSGRTTNK